MHLQLRWVKSIPRLVSSADSFCDSFVNCSWKRMRRSISKLSDVPDQLIRNDNGKGIKYPFGLLVFPFLSSVFACLLACRFISWKWEFANAKKTGWLRFTTIKKSKVINWKYRVEGSFSPVKICDFYFLRRE